MSSTCETPTMSIPLFHSQKFSITMCFTYTAAGTGTVKSCASSSANHLAPHNNAKDVRSQSCYANKRRLVSIVSESAFGAFNILNTSRNALFPRPSSISRIESSHEGVPSDGTAEAGDGKSGNTKYRQNSRLAHVRFCVTVFTSSVLEII